jgi:hypothetical protein
MRVNRALPGLRPLFAEGEAGQPLVELSPQGALTFDILGVTLQGQSVYVDVVGAQSQSGANIIATVPAGQLWVIESACLVASTTGDTYTYRPAIIDTVSGNAVWLSPDAAVAISAGSPGLGVGFNVANCPRFLGPGSALGYHAWNFVGGFTSSQRLFAKIVQLPSVF